MPRSGEKWPPTKSIDLEGGMRRRRPGRIDLLFEFKRHGGGSESAPRVTGTHMTHRGPKYRIHAKHEYGVNTDPGERKRKSQRHRWTGEISSPQGVHPHNTFPLEKPSCCSAYLTSRHRLQWISLARAPSFPCALAIAPFCPRRRTALHVVLPSRGGAVWPSTEARWGGVRWRRGRASGEGWQ